MATNTRVLVIEDDPDVCESMRFLLDDAGYQVDCATSLTEALTLLHTAAYQLVVTDLFSVSDRNAFASVAPIMAAAYPTPVAILTAHRLPAELDRSPMPSSWRNPLISRICSHRSPPRWNRP